MKSSKPVVTVEDYLALHSKPVRDTLEKLRQIIRKAAPHAEEVISYQMPGYKLNGMLVYFAAAKDHYGFYPTPSGIEAFRDKLDAYEVSKGTIKFPMDKPLPVKLITDIVKFRVQENLEKSRMKEVSKKKPKK